MSINGSFMITASMVAMSMNALTNAVRANHDGTVELGLLGVWACNTLPHVAVLQVLHATDMSEAYDDYQRPTLISELLQAAHCRTAIT